MTRDEAVTLTQKLVGSADSPTRFGYDNKSAYQQCIRDLQLLVISCPSVLSYIGYLNTQKAHGMLPEIVEAANLVIKGITKYERNQIEANVVDNYVQSFKQLLDRQNDLMLSAHRLYTEQQQWLYSFRTRVSNLLSEPLRSDEDKELLHLFLSSSPKQIKGNTVLLSDSVRVEIVEGIASLYYGEQQINAAPLITKGCSLLGSTVTYSKKTATLDSSINGTATSVEFQSATYNTPVITNYSSYKSIVLDIADSGLSIDTEDEEIATCLRVYKAQVTSSAIVLDPLVFDSHTKSTYRKLVSACLKWKLPEITGLIHKFGFNYVCSNNTKQSVYDQLKEVAAEIAVFTDNRGAVR